MTLLSTEAILAGVRELPALPAVVLELIQSLGDTDANTDQLAARIARDQGLAAKTLRLANSSFYGMPRQVTSIADATTILGWRTVRSVATAAGLTAMMHTPDCPGFDFKAFWRHAIGTALCAASLARGTPLDEGLGFTAGLLHDLGRLALASSFAGPYAQVLRHRGECDGPVLESERAVLGTDHAAVGSLLAEHWCFASCMVEAIAAHHEPQPLTSRPGPADLADLVHVADNMAHALDLSHADDDLVPPLSMAAWSRLDLNERRCVEVVREVRMQHEAVCNAILS
ncbi:HDOD domain-containing protein [Methylibium sp.]|uniref:HDOD domain-containing protein n=1 Tax=Methylibium sp. TaxID=2067992 RepID=UPI003D110FF6